MADLNSLLQEFVGSALLGVENLMVNLHMVQKEESLAERKQNKVNNCYSCISVKKIYSQIFTAGVVFPLLLAILSARRSSYHSTCSKNSPHRFHFVS